MKPDTEKILSILASHENDPSNLIAILQDVQAEYNYLSEANLTLIADTLGLSVSKVYSVATFYENFSLEAKGKHIVKVCAGTACHVRKSGPIYDAIYEYLGLHGKKKTSDDGLFTLETVACLGACGLAPVMTVDGEVLTADRVERTAPGWLTVVLHQGKNRQVRRMCAAAGLTVARLIRVREGSLTLDGLEKGRWRLLMPSEVEELKA